MPMQLFVTATTAAGATAIFDFGEQAYERAYLARGTMTTAAQWNVYGSTNGSTYFKVMHPQAATATTTPYSFVISSGVTDCMIEFPIISRYVQFVATGAACAAVTMSVIAHYKP